MSGDIARPYRVQFALEGHDNVKVDAKNRMRSSTPYHAECGSCGEMWIEMGSYPTLSEAIKGADEQNGEWRAEGSLVLPYRIITTVYVSHISDEAFPIRGSNV
jgi:hypothetical protein